MKNRNKNNYTNSNKTELKDVIQDQRAICVADPNLEVLPFA